jgi:acetoacetyl-CoA synthetase
MSKPADPSPNGSAENEALWRHPSPESTYMRGFLQRINKRYHQNFSTYDELYQWSIDNIENSWGEIWEYVGIRASQPYKTVVSDSKTMFPRPAWFAGARLNFAENLLFPTQEVDENSPAVIAATETTRETVGWQGLRDRVKACQAGMLALNLKAGDRVAGYVANHPNALVAMLAATSLGAIWTAVSPDTGVTAVLDRMVQIEPTLLFTDNAVMYNGKTHPVLPKVKEIIASLPTLKGTIIFETVPEMETSIDEPNSASKVFTYNSFTSMNPSPPKALKFEQLEPEHPVYILYSSGTTGAPKCIVHGAIGTLIQHKKEHILQSDIRAGDRLFYFTTCTWMMWHWLVSGLASGATLILYDGSPFQYLSNGSSVKDDLAMPRLIDELGITQFGTSAKYLSVLEQKNIMPKDHGLHLKTLKAIYSTGSPLAPSTFQYVYKAFGAINLGSITGGTDIISLFGAPCPLHPVYVGEIQVLGLGMAVQAWDYTGKNISSTGEAGDLVCVKPFPCQPVMFWSSKGKEDGEKKYKSSYFEEFEGVWHHGDYVRFDPRTGGLIMLGRSDGILKPSGVRFGSAEIYNLLLKHFPDQVEDALCIGRRREKDDDETVVLFLKMKDGVPFSEYLVKEIKAVVRKELSARHVPGIVDECPEIPHTTNGKKVEGAVKQILCGLNVKTSASVANAGCLEWYRGWAAKHED